MDRSAAVEELKHVYAVLGADLDLALELGRRDPGPFALRTLFRTYFAFVEGLAFQLRQVTLASLENTDFLTHAELAILKEERFQLDRKGIPEPKENFQSFLPNLLFSIRCYVKNHGASYEPNIGVAGWEAMRKAVEVRDRLTHPRSTTGLEVSEHDERYLIMAAAWWKQTLLEMFQACGEADQKFSEQLQRTGQ
jgi:hypothetical protein